MRVVHKYRVDLGTDARVRMPVGAEVVNVDSIQAEVYVWAIVDRAEVREVERPIYFLPTGGKIPDDAEFLGTAIVQPIGLVWHVFEEVRF